VKQIWKIIGWIFPALLFCGYVGLYGMLSAQGRYAPEAIGLNGVKSYSWRPCGFTESNGISMKPHICLFFAPLYWLDVRYWHTRNESETGKYPVHRISREDAIRMIPRTLESSTGHDRAFTNDKYGDARDRESR